jgi:hypothetical protein
MESGQSLRENESDRSDESWLCIANSRIRGVYWSYAVTIPMSEHNESCALQWAELLSNCIKEYGNVYAICSGALQGVPYYASD